MMKMLLRSIMIVFFLIGISLSGLAQNSGDRLYSQGLELQKKQTIKSQKLAISKFQSAKTLYDSETKKKQCDDAIIVSNNIIKTIIANKEPKESINNKETDIKTSVLELSNEKLQVNYEQRTVAVNVTTTESDWTITPITSNDGVAFVSINPHLNEKYFDIIIPINISTQKRKQVIEVRAGNLIKKIVIEQSGKPTILSVEKSVVEFSSNGGNKSVEVYSNSNSIEKDNNNRNWKVVSKPQWINIIGEEFKEKGILGKLEDKVKGLVKKSSTSAEDPSVITSIMKIVVSSKSKNEPSRNGKIVISSDKQQATIIVHQK